MIEIVTKDKVPKYLSCRYMMAYVGVIGFTCVYLIRFNISVAIVCMVKPDDQMATNETSFTLDDNTNSSFTNVSYDDKRRCATDYGTDPRTAGTLEWSRQLRGWILSSFFYGYVFTQMPSGWLSTRYGGKRVFGAGMLATTIATLLVPVAANTHYSLVITLRVIMGLGTGVVFPAMHHMWSKWALPLETTFLTALTYSGTSIGNIVAFFLSGWLCEVPYAGGWPLIFYVNGLMCLTFLFLWTFLVYDSPRQHPRISEIEKNYLEKMIGGNLRKNTQSVPWMSFVKSPPFWAILGAHMCQNWGNYALATGLPSYMKDVLKFDMKQSGFYAALPYVVFLIVSVLAGWIVDLIRSKGVRTVVMRKLMQTLASVISLGSLIAVGHVTCENRIVAVTLMITCVAGSAFFRGGFMPNFIDIAPRYAGIMLGITNTAATIPGMVAPTIMGAIIKQGTREEYQIVFYLCAGFYALGMVIFLLWASGEVQEWAVDKLPVTELTASMEPEIINKSSKL